MTGRKFWLAIGSFVSMLIVALGGAEETATQVSALIMAGATVVAYIIGEGMADAANAGSVTNLDGTDVLKAIEIVERKGQAGRPFGRRRISRAPYGGYTMYDVNRVLSVSEEAEVGYLEKANNKNLDGKTENAGDKNYTKYARDLDAMHPAFTTAASRATRGATCLWTGASSPPTAGTRR